MRSLALLGVVSCCFLIGCRGQADGESLDSLSTISGDIEPSTDGSPTGGGGYPGGFQRHGGGGGRGFGGDPRAGRQERPQRPEMEE